MITVTGIDLNGGYIEDGAGNALDSVGVNLTASGITVDTLSPSVMITEIDSNSNGSNDSWSWSCKNAETCRYRHLVSTNATEASITGNFSTITTASHLSNNRHYLHVEAIDDAGNSSGIESSDMLATSTPDTSPPTISAVSGISSNSNTAFAKQGDVITLAVEFNDPVIVMGSPQLQVTIGSDIIVIETTFAGATNTALATHNFNYTVAANKNGTITVTGIDLNGGSIEDGVGNALDSTGVNFTIGEITIDTLSPSVVITEIDSNSNGSNDSWSWSCKNAETCRYRHLVSTNSTEASITGNFNTITTASPLSNNRHYLHVEAIDDAGNSSGIESSSMLATPVSDTVSPRISTVSGTSSNSNTAFAKQGDVITLIVEFNDPVIVMGSPQLQVTVGSDITVIETTFTGATNIALATHNFNYTVAANKNGTITVTGIDLNSGSIEDGVGNALDSTGVNFTIGEVTVDTLSPSVVITEIDSSSNGSNDSWIWSCENAETCRYRHLVSMNTTEASITGNFSTITTASPLSNNRHYLHVEAIDDAGNSSGIESSSMLATPVSDTVSPRISTVSGTSSNSNTAFAKQGDVITLTVEFNDPVIVMGSPQLQVTIGSDITVIETTFAGAKNIALATHNFNYTVAANKNGTITVTGIDLNGGSIEDGVGNALDSTGVNFTIGEVTVDTLSPSVVITEIDSSSNGSNDSWIWSCKNTETCRYRHLVSTNATEASITGNFSAIITASPLSNNRHYLHVEAIDDAGNSSGIESSSMLATPVSDTVSPRISTVIWTSSNSNTAFAKQGDVITLTVEFNDPVIVMGSPQLQVTIGSDITVIETTFAGATNTALATHNFNYTVAANKNGTITVTGIDLNGGSIEDGVGNALDSTGVNFTIGEVTVDTLSPSVVITEIDSSSNGSNDSWIWSCKNAETCRYRHLVSTNATEASITGNFSAIITASPLSNNRHYLHVEAIDDAGNSSGIESSSMLATLISDTVSPTISEISGLSSNSNTAFAKQGDVVTLTVEFDDSVVVTGSPQVQVTIGSDITVIETTFAGATNTALATHNFNYTVAANKNGTITVTGIDLNGGSIEDGVGNALDSTGVNFTIGEITIDTLSPSVVITEIDSNSNGSNDSWSWLCENAETCRYRHLVSTNATEASITGNFSTITTASPLSNNRHYLHVEAIDDAGNSSGVVSSNILNIAVSDAVPPKVSNIRAKGKKYRKQETITFFVDFNEQVIITGVPSLNLTIGSTEVSAIFVGESGDQGSTHEFTYIVVQSNNGNVKAQSFSAFTDEKNIEDLAGNRLEVFEEIRIVDVEADTMAPYIWYMMIKSSNNNIFWAQEGDTVTFIAIFSEPVIVTGAPSIKGAFGSSPNINVAFAGTIGSAAITHRFTYTLPPGIFGIGLWFGLNLNGGKIIDTANNPLRNNRPLTTNDEYLWGLYADADPPRVNEITAVSSNIDDASLAKEGHEITFTVKFPETIKVTGAPKLRFKIGDNQNILEGVFVGETEELGYELKFTYMVDAGRSGDILVTGFDFNEGEILDDGGNYLSAEMTKSTSGVSVDSLNPMVTKVIVKSSNNNHSLAKQGDVITLTADFSEPVALMGAPSLQFTIGNSVRTREGVYAGVTGSLSSTHSFTYTVETGENGTITIAGFNLNGGSVSDNSGNTLPSIGAILPSSGVLVDASNPVVTIINDGSNWIWSCSDFNNCRYRHSVNTNASETSLNGSFGNVTTATPLSGGTYYVHVEAIDPLGNSSGIISSSLTGPATDPNAPEVSVIRVAAGRYGAGKMITFSIDFDESVVVTGTPTLSFEIGGTTATASFAGESGAIASSHDFSYTVQENINGTIVVTAFSVFSNTNNIQDGSDNHVAEFNNLVIENVTVDTNGPIVSNVISLSNNAVSTLAKEGDTITLIATFNEIVTVTGLPKLQFSIGSDTNTMETTFSGTAEIASTKQEFSYTIEAGQNGDISVSGINLIGGEIADEAGNSNSSVGASKEATGVRVDTTIPTVINVSVVEKAYNLGETITFDLEFNEPVTVNGSPTISVKLGWFLPRSATFSGMSGNKSTIHSFTYTVQNYDTGNMIFQRFGFINDTNNIHDGSGNRVGQQANIIIQGASVNIVDNVAPRMISVTSSSQSEKAIVNQGKTIMLTATFSEQVVVTGAPKLQFTLGTDTSTTIGSSFTGTVGSASTTHDFTYTIQEGDNGTISVTSLELNGGSVADKAGNACASLGVSLPAIGVTVDTTDPTVSLTKDDTGWSWVCNDVSACRYRHLVSTDATETSLGGNFGSVTRATPLAGGSYYVHVEAIDEVGNTSSVTSSIAPFISPASDTTAPTVVAVRVNPGEYGYRNTITFSVDFSESVKINGNPTLNFKVGALAGSASFNGNSGEIASSHDFTYVVPDNVNGSLVVTGFSDFNDTQNIEDGGHNRVAEFNEITISNVILDTLDCHDVTTTEDAHLSNAPDSFYRIGSTSFYRMNLDGLLEDGREFTFCLAPNAKVRAELIHSFVGVNNSLVWEGVVVDTPKFRGYQMGNSIILVKRNNQLAGRAWVNGMPYRIWALEDGVQQIERLSTRNVLVRDTTVDSPILHHINMGENIPEISMMTVFTSDAANKIHDIYAFSEMAVAVANFSYRASSIKGRFKLTNVVAHSQDGTNLTALNSLSRIVNSTDGWMDDVHTLRDQNEADIVVLFTATDYDAYVLEILARQENAFAVSNYDLSHTTGTFSHEVGHLLGAKHYGTAGFTGGDGEPEGAWITLMTSTQTCTKQCSSIDLFSNPKLTFMGQPTGVAGVTDNARMINWYISAFASYRGSTYADISGEGTLLENGALVTDIAGATSPHRGAGPTYIIEVPSGATNLRIQTSGGTGNLDLYVKAKAMALDGFGDCMKETNFSNNELCLFEQPEAGRYYIALWPNTVYSGATLRVNYDEPSGDN